MYHYDPAQLSNKELRDRLNATAPTMDLETAREAAHLYREMVKRIERGTYDQGNQKLQAR